MSLDICPCLVDHVTIVQTTITTHGTSSHVLTPTYYQMTLDHHKPVSHSSGVHISCTVSGFYNNNNFASCQWR